MSSGLYIALVSIHGLIRSHDLELGRNADTGGQTKCVVELADALGACEGVERVELLTRRIDDPEFDDDYAAPEAAEGYLERLFQLNSLNEEVLQRLLELLSARGGRQKARRLFHEFRRRLQEELGLEPLPDTRRCLEA